MQTQTKSKLLLLLLSPCLLLLSCSTTDKANVAAAAPTITAIADVALTAAGDAPVVPAFNALSGMALAYYEGNSMVTGSGNVAVALAVLKAFPNVTPAQLNATAAALPVP